MNTAIVSLRITLPTTDKNQGNRIAAEAEVRRQQQLLAAAEAEVRGGLLRRAAGVRIEARGIPQRAPTVSRTRREHIGRSRRQPMRRAARTCSACWTRNERAWTRNWPGREEWWITGRAS